MLEQTNEFNNQIESSAQYVTPKIVARFGDNRFLKNLSVKSSNQSHEKAVQSYNPEIYWNFYNNDYILNSSQTKINDSSGNNNAGVATGSAEIPKTPQKKRCLEALEDDFNRFNLSTTSGSSEEQILTDNFTLTNEVPIYFNLNRNKWFIVNKRTVQTIFDVTNRYVANYISVTSNITKQLDYALVESGGVDGAIECDFGVYGTDSGGLFNLVVASIQPRSNQGVILRFTDENNYILILLKNPSANDILFNPSDRVYFEVVEVIDGQHQTAQKVILGPGVTWSTTDRLKIEFIGNYLNFYRNNIFIEKISLLNKKNPIGATKHGLASKNVAFTPVSQYDSGGIAWGFFSLDAFNYNDYSFNPSSSGIGLGGYISDIGEIYRTSATDKLTAGLFVKPENYIGNQWLLDFKWNDYESEISPTGQNVAYLKLNDGTLEARAYMQSSEGGWISYLDLEYTPDEAFENNEWIQAGFIIDGSSFKLFCNGEIVDESNSFSGNLLISKINEFRSMFNTSGLVDDVFVLTTAVTDSEISRFLSLSNDEIYIENNIHFNENNVFSGIEEETFSYIGLSLKNNENKKLITNGEYYLCNSLEDINFNGFFVSKHLSDESLLNGVYPYQIPPYIEAEFDNFKVNKIKISTGFALSKIKDFELYYHISGEDEESVEVILSEDFEDYGSYKEIVLDNTYIIDKIKLVVLSSDAPESPAVVHQINLYYEEDISDDVINFAFSKVRDNFEATLPIGSTSSNNGTLTLNNTHQKYNVYNNASPYYGYIQPEVKIFLSLIYETSLNVYEEVVLGQELFVENWNTSSSGMTVDISFIDYSVVFQEKTASFGFVFEDVTAGFACSEIAKGAGVAARKIFYYDSFHKNILKNKPFAYFKLNDSTPAVDGEVIIEDEGGLFSATLTGDASSYSLGASPIVEHEKAQEISIDSRTLASLYQITAESVGLEPPRIFRTNYALESKTLDVESEDQCRIEVADAVVDASQDFSVELVIEPHRILPGEERGLVSKVDGADITYYIYLVRDAEADECALRVDVSTDEDDYTLSHLFTVANFLNKKFHIVFTKTSNDINFYVNNQKETLEIEGNIVEHENNLVLLRKDLEIETLSFDGKISHVSFYDKALDETSIENHYNAFCMNNLYLFPYLYFGDSTYWEGMLEFATADVGMFYFNEFSDFVYEYKNTFHEPHIQRHSSYQWNFHEDKNIVNASYALDIQVNKIIVKVNPKTSSNASVVALWRAESGESLAVTKVDGDIGSGDTSVAVLSTEQPIWPRSGYIKIDNEIIKYNDREINKFLNLERGQFGTLASSHSSQALCRETRVYDFEFTEKPALSVRYPFLVAQIFEDRAEIDKFETTPFGGRVVVSASDVDLNNPSSDNEDATLVYLEGTNPLTEKEYFFAISGVAVAEKVSEEKVEDQLRETNGMPSRLRPKEMTVDNKFIQTTSYARKIADFILEFFGEPVQIIKVEAIGIPHLQLGDRVRIESLSELDIYNKEYWIIETSIDYNGGVSQTFTLRAVS